MKGYIIVILLLLGGAGNVSAQKERSHIRSGNKAYAGGDYVEAEVDYLRALELAPESLEARFNLADAQYKQERYADAEKLLQELVRDTTNGKYRADIHYNLGNVYMKQRKFEEAAEAYKNSLRVNPSDIDAKFNLAYAQKMLEKDRNQDNQQNQQNQNNRNNQNNDQNKDQNDQNKDQNDQNKDQNDQNKDQNDQNKDQNDQNKDQNDQNKDQNDQNKDQNDRNNDQNDNGENNDGNGNPRPNEMTRDEAEKLLQAIQNNEDNTRKKVDAQKAKGGAVQSGKNW